MKLRMGLIKTYGKFQNPFAASAIAAMEFVLSVVGFVQQHLQRVILQLFPKYVENGIRKRFKAAGVNINGSSASDIQVLKPEFYINMALDVSLGLGEGFMDELWTVKDLRAFFAKILGAKRQGRKKKSERAVYKMRNYLKNLPYKLLNMQNRLKAWEVAERHYDMGNSLFEAILDPYMNYSCAYWRTATTLEDAQLAKMELIAAKLKLKPGMKVLDIGCGWGGLAKYLAKHYQVSVVGVTISKEQAEYAKDFCIGLDIEIKLIDYRDLNAPSEFDRIVSVGMFEHVGVKNYRKFFEIGHDCLKDDGLFLLHTIGLNNTLTKCVDPWMDKYIFPNGTIPYHTELAQFTDEKFVIEDWQNMGYHYSKTLDAWDANFDKYWSKFSQEYGQRFYRMFKYFLIMHAENFKARRCQLWQVVLSKHGIEGGYESVR